MTTWTADELERTGRSGQLDIAPDRPDGTPGPATTVWVVRVRDDFYVRSYRGSAGSWYHASITQ